MLDSKLIKAFISFYIKRARARACVCSKIIYMTVFNTLSFIEAFKRTRSKLQNNFANSISTKLGNMSFASGYIWFRLYVYYTAVRSGSNFTHSHGYIGHIELLHSALSSEVRGKNCWHRGTAYCLFWCRVAAGGYRGMCCPRHMLKTRGGIYRFENRDILSSEFLARKWSNSYIDGTNEILYRVKFTLIITLRC